MNLRSILFPTDFSEYNDAALHYASSLATDAGAKLYIVHVHDTREITPAMGEATYMYASSWEAERQDAKKRLRQVLPSSPVVQYEHHDLTGVPDDEIVDFAKTKSVDLIVMASHGRTGISRLLMGSVAESVLRRAPCPVLIVKQPSAHSQHEEQVSTTIASTRTAK